MNGATFLPLFLRFPSHRGGRGNEEPNEAERIGGVPPERQREPLAPMLDGDLRQSPSSRLPRQPTASIRPELRAAVREATGSGMQGAP